MIFNLRQNIRILITCQSAFTYYFAPLFPHSFAATFLKSLNVIIFIFNNLLFVYCLLPPHSLFCILLLHSRFNTFYQFCKPRYKSGSLSLILVKISKSMVIFPLNSKDFNIFQLKVLSLSILPVSYSLQQVCYWYFNLQLYMCIQL